MFPCCDIAIFPSVVAEAGPLVSLEALASGCFPLGTYFEGVGASIDAVAESLPAKDAQWMKLSPDEDQTVMDIVTNVSGAIALEAKHRYALRTVAVERYEWKSVAARLASTFRSMT